MPARRELVRYAQLRGLSERWALRLACLSPSVLRYERKDDGNGPLRERIAALAHHHRRHGYRMIHLRLTQEGWAVNLKRVRRLYRDTEPDGAAAQMEESRTWRAAGAGERGVEHGLRV